MKEKREKKTSKYNRIVGNWTVLLTIFALKLEMLPPFRLSVMLLLLLLLKILFEINIVVRWAGAIKCLLFPNSVLDAAEAGDEAAVV